MKTITVLSVRQPWAWLLCENLKNVENRSWKTNYRGTLYIHAGKSFDLDALNWMFDRSLVTHAAALEVFKHFCIIPCKEKGGIKIMKNKEEFGAIVGRVDLIDCGRSQSVWAQQDVKYHWTVRHGQHIVPIPMRGQLGLFQSPMPPMIENRYF